MILLHTECFTCALHFLFVVCCTTFKAFRGGGVRKCCCHHFVVQLVPLVVASSVETKAACSKVDAVLLACCTVWWAAMRPSFKLLQFHALGGPELEFTLFKKMILWLWRLCHRWYRRRFDKNVNLKKKKRMKSAPNVQCAGTMWRLEHTWAEWSQRNPSWGEWRLEPSQDPIYSTTVTMLDTSLPRHLIIPEVTEWDCVRCKINDQQVYRVFKGLIKLITVINGHQLCKKENPAVNHLPLLNDEHAFLFDSLRKMDCTIRCWEEQCALIREGQIYKKGQKNSLLFS